MENQCKISAKLITYNRAHNLANTLDAWFNSDLKCIPLEVLDNASTDNTAPILQKMVEAYPDLKICRHPLNIGAVGNILRAYERFTSEYCWVICDDDTIDGSVVPELFELLKSEVEAIIVGGEGLTSKDYGFLGTVTEFLDSGGKFLFAGSFVPGLVFKREYFQNGTLFRCNKSAGCLYPQLSLVEAIMARNATIATLSRPLITRKSNSDIDGIEVNWLYETFKAAGFLTVAQGRWIEEVMQVRGPRNFIQLCYEALKARAHDALPLHRALEIFGIYPRHLYAIKWIQVFTACVPTKPLTYLFALLGKYRKRIKLESAERF